MSLLEVLRKLLLTDYDEAAEKVKRVSRTLTEFSNNVLSLYDGFNSWWEETGVQICQAIYNFASLEFDEEKKKMLIKRYKTWGTMGWTANAKMESAFFDFTPATIEEADNAMRKYCTLENIKEMAAQMETVDVDKNDLAEALLCYENGAFKSSTLIIYALIDHELISMGFRYEPKDGEIEGSRKVGLSAACDYRKGKKAAFAQGFIYSNLWFLNIMGAIIQLFQKADDFKSEPPMINRNFIAHGMSQRSVSAIDCLKVWSALYCLTAVLPHLEESLK